MVEETIRKIVENAHQESERIRKEAEERSAQIRDEIIRNAQAEAKAQGEKARIAGAEKERNARAGCEAETAELKASAQEKEKKAVEMVISMLA